MRQYQALQQQRQRNLQMMPQGQAGNTSVSQLLQNQYAAASQGNQGELQKKCAHGLKPSMWMGVG